jgi:hypothetical protein
MIGTGNYQICGMKMLKPSFFFPVVAAQPHTWSIGGKNGTLVTVDLDTGETTFGEHYTPDEAARVFWEAVGIAARWASPRETALGI